MLNSAAVSFVLLYVSGNYHRSHLPWQWDLLIFGVIAALMIIICLIFWFLVPGGKRQVKGLLRNGGSFSGSRFGTRYGGYGGQVMSMGTVALEPMSKPKGWNDCPQCGDPVEPGVTKCPHCHWNLHSLNTNPVTGGQGLTPVAIAPLIAGAVEAATTPIAPAPDTAATLTSTPVPPVPVEDPTARMGVIQHDIVIGGALAFTNGERVRIEGESPDPARPDYKFVVTSSALGKKFRLSDLDIFT